MISDTKKTREQLLIEIEELRLRIDCLERKGSAKEEPVCDDQLIWAVIREMIDTIKEPTIIFEITKERCLGHYIEVNDKICEMLGYTKEELKTIPLSEIENGESRKGFSEAVEMYLASGAACFETELVRKGGEFVAVDVDVRDLWFLDRRALLVIGRDISRHKAAERELREKEEKYRNVVDNANAGIVIIQDKLVRHSNPKMEEITGYTERELNNKPFLDLIHADHRDLLLRRHEKRLAGENPIDVYDFKAVHKNGEVKWYETKPVRINWENRPAALCFISDVTELRAASEKLKESEEKYRKVIEYLPEAFLMNRFSDLKFVDVNQAAVDIFGYSREEFLELTLEDFCGQTREPRQHPESFLRAGDVRGVETVYLNSDNIPVPIEINAKAILVRGEEYLMILIRDVTQKRLAEKELRQSEAKFRTILESTGYGYYETDNKGVFTFINDQTARIVGYPKEQIVGVCYKEITTKAVEKKLFKAFSQVYNDERLFSEVDFIFKKKDGRKVHLQGTITINRDLNGVKQGFKGLVHDITRQKENEKKLRELHKDNLEMAHAAGMAEMASNTLHNVGNVLNSVKISAQVIHETLRKEPYDMKSLGKAKDMLKENLGNIERFITTDPNGKRLIEYFTLLCEEIIAKNDDIVSDVNRLLGNIRLIENVVSAQQTYAGIGGIEDYYDLISIVEDSLTLKSGLLKRNGVTVTKNYSRVPKIAVQKSKLIHVLVNIVNNAMDAMADIPSDQRCLGISVTQNDQSVLLSVSDSGQGISKKNLKKVFVHGYTTKKDGHGFGLHSSANYMSEMNGRLYVESEGVGRGASFILEFKKE